MVDRIPALYRELNPVEQPLASYFIDGAICNIRSKIKKKNFFCFGRHKKTNTSTSFGEISKATTKFFMPHSQPGGGGEGGVCKYLLL
jgi:hypothetical protein